ADFVADVRALTPSEAAELVAPSRDGLLGGLAQLERRLVSSLKSHARHARNRWERVAARRAFQQPFDRIRDESQRLDDLQARLERAARQRLHTQRTRLAELAAKLDALSPLGVLARGYSLTHAPDGALLRRAADAQPGDLLRTRLASGEVFSRVERITTDSPGEAEPAYDDAG
ncbi:MAG TPA: exodeoxyribonuclease VII large subunit, partial [Pirellulales bacterium]